MELANLSQLAVMYGSMNHNLVQSAVNIELARLSSLGIIVESFF